MVVKSGAIWRGRTTNHRGWKVVKVLKVSPQVVGFELVGVPGRRGKGRQRMTLEAFCRCYTPVRA